MQLAKNIAGNLGVTSWYVCRGTDMEDRWHWEAKELLPQDNYTLIFSATNAPELIPTGSSTWLLKASITGRHCIPRWGTTYTHPAGKLACLGQQYYNETKEKLYGKEKIKRVKIAQGHLVSSHFLGSLL